MLCIELNQGPKVNIAQHIFLIHSETHEIYFLGDQHEYVAGGNDITH